MVDPKLAERTTAHAQGGWESHPDGYVLGGPELAAHLACVGSRPAIVRTRELDDLDERLLRYTQGCAQEGRSH